MSGKMTNCKKDGFNDLGLNKHGFDRKGIHKDTGTKYDPEGYDVIGFDRYDFNVRGFKKCSCDEPGCYDVWENEHGYSPSGYRYVVFKKKYSGIYDTKAFCIDADNRCKFGKRVCDEEGRLISDPIYMIIEED